jgi:hypothetical protein
LLEVGYPEFGGEFEKLSKSIELGIKMLERLWMVSKSDLGIELDRTVSRVVE